MYAAANASKDFYGKTAAGIEIIHRLATPSGFAISVFGGSMFPKYAAIQVANPNNPASFNAPNVAQTELRHSAVALEKNVVSTVKTLGSGIVTVAISAAIIALVILINKGRK